MKDQLKRILNLVRKTGDTMIVTDPNGEDVYVVMNLDQYESLLNSHSPISFAEDDLVNFDDEKSDNSWEDLKPTEESIKSPQREPDIWQTMKPAGGTGETWDVSKMSENELQELERQYQTFAAQTTEDSISTNGLDKISTPELEVQKPLNSKENDADFGEEQFYLEPIE